MTRPSDKELAALLRTLSANVGAVNPDLLPFGTLDVAEQAFAAADALDREPTPLTFAEIDDKWKAAQQSAKPKSLFFDEPWFRDRVTRFAHAINGRAASPSGPSWSERVEKAITASFRLTKPLTGDQRKFYESRISEIESNLRAAFPEYAPQAPKTEEK